MGAAGLAAEAVDGVVEEAVEDAAPPAEAAAVDPALSRWKKKQKELIKGKK